MHNLFTFLVSLAIAFAAIILIMIITDYVIFIGAILSKSYSRVKINIKSKLISLFVLITTICYGLLNY